MNVMYTSNVYLCVMYCLLPSCVLPLTILSTLSHYLSVRIITKSIFILATKLDMPYLVHFLGAIAEISV